MKHAGRHFNANKTGEKMEKKNEEWLHKIGKAGIKCMILWLASVDEAERQAEARKFWAEFFMENWPDDIISAKEIEEMVDSIMLAVDKYLLIRGKLRVDGEKNAKRHAIEQN
jgi:hypothetical protein